MFKVQKNISLKPYTSFKIGGKARFFIQAKTKQNLVTGCELALKESLPILILGGGSNLLINDKKTINAAVILITNQDFEISKNKIKVGAGFGLDSLVKKSVENNLRGLEYLSGIPGTVGGAIYGNAGAYGKSISDYLVEAEVFNGRDFKKFSKLNCQFSYRDSFFKRTKFAIWQGLFELEPGNRKVLENIRQAILAYRQIRYPNKFKSAGSFFKNVSQGKFAKKALKNLPKCAFSGQEVAAGFLIEQVGLLGKIFGGAKIADHQGNYLINFKDAKAEDVIKLAKLARKKVFQKFGVELEPEVQLIGFSNKVF
ncbi:MAG: UDP-N-acetylmuramate dehydrogenase [Patescibacteria group bacterium]